ncbi:MAG: M23 family metallopeptidase [Polyangiales bacterium]
MRVWLAGAVVAFAFACDEPPPPVAPPPEPPPEVVEVTPPAPAPEPRPELALRASGSREQLPRVVQWLPEARRCGRHGRRRYCNGPRRAPEPAGESGALAERLGLGTHRAAAELIRSQPRPEWIAAARDLLPPLRYPMSWPIDGGRFGRGIQRRGRKVTHRGIDVTAEVGTPVRAVADALVGYADNTVDGYGNLLVLLHADGQVSAYAHLDAIHVHAGQVVDAGDLVARGWQHGAPRGPHLHFEWREEGDLADPMRRFEETHVPRWMRPLLARLGN